MICIITFLSTHYAIAAERHCEKQVPCRLIPLPPRISAGCGLALKVQQPQLAEAMQVLAERDIPHQAVYRRTEEDHYEEIL